MVSSEKATGHVLSLFQRAHHEALIRPLTVGDRADVEAMINVHPVAFLYAAEHLELLGLPATAGLGSTRGQRGFMGIFVPQEAEEQRANVGIDAPLVARKEEAELVPPGASAVTSNPSILPRVKQVAETFLSPLSSLPGMARSLGEVSAGTLLGAENFARPTRLVGAFWLGSNCMPLVIPEEHREAVADTVARSGKTVASIFGLAADVMPLWKLVEPRMPKPLSVRARQPLLYLDPAHTLSSYIQADLSRSALQAPPLDSSGVRWARTSDKRSLLKASVSMFTEEVGYDPMTRDAYGYARRVEDLIRTGRSVVATNTDGVVVFKADVGLAHADQCQVQGVWLHPAYRALHLSEPLLGQAFELMRTRFPHISLYVNDYNERARKLYAGLGMEQVGIFATVLF